MAREWMNKTDFLWSVSLPPMYIQDRLPSVCLPQPEQFKPPVRGHCPPGFFLRREFRTQQEAHRDGDGRQQRGSRVCRRCTACPPGVGAVRPCGRRTDTVCDPCVPGTSYADLTSYEQPCLRCTPCSRHAVIERNCTVMHDAICHRCRKGTFSLSSVHSIDHIRLPVISLPLQVWV